MNYMPALTFACAADITRPTTTLTSQCGMFHSPLLDGVGMHPDCPPAPSLPIHFDAFPFLIASKAVSVVIH